MKRYLARAALTLAALGAFGASPYPVGAAEQKVVSLKFSDQFPATHRYSLMLADWGKEVTKRTNGRVKVDFFPGATLTPPAQTYDGVLKGIADVGDTFASYTAGRFPLMEAIDLPYGYKSAAMGTRLANEFYKKFKPKELDAVQVMFFFTAGPQLLCSKGAPVTKLEDVKGMKVRSTGSSAKIIEHLGAAPVGMPMGEAYDALSRGVVNGVVAPLEVMKGWKLSEVLSGCTAYGSSHLNAAFVVMNKNKWNQIAPADQKIIEQINGEWIEKSAKNWDDADKEGLEALQQKGGKVFQLSKEEQQRWAAQLRPLFEEYAAALKTKGLPGEEAVKFCQEYVRTH
jgi:TRAP-type C4-dicarboxylate transport system substrate-binding protein